MITCADIYELSQGEDKEGFRSLHSPSTLHWAIHSLAARQPLPALPRPVPAHISAWPLQSPAQHESMSWQSLQQAEEFPVVLITLSFRHQAVQLVDQLGLHLQGDTKAITHRLLLWTSTRGNLDPELQQDIQQHCSALLVELICNYPGIIIWQDYLFIKLHFLRLSMIM